MGKYKLEGSLSEWTGPCSGELWAHGVTIISNWRGALRMSPGPKKGGRKKMRLIVKGFLEIIRQTSL